MDKLQPRPHRHARSVKGVRRSLAVMRQPSRATSPNDVRNPSPGPRRLMTASLRATLSPGRGHFDSVFMGWEQSTTDCHSAPARHAKIDDRSGNVAENKGQPISAAGRPPTCRLPICRPADRLRLRPKPTMYYYNQEYSRRAKMLRLRTRTDRGSRNLKSGCWVSSSAQEGDFSL